MNIFLRNYASKRVSEISEYVRTSDNHRFDEPMISTEDSDRYFNTTYRYGDGVDGIMSDLDLLKDSKTPDSLKEYIQRVGAHAVHGQQNVSAMLEDSDQILDSMVPDSLQTANEVKSFIEN